MNDARPVPYDMIEGDDRVVIVLRCEPLGGSIVRMDHFPGKGFEAWDAEGSTIRFANPRVSFEAMTRLPTIVAAVHAGSVTISRTCSPKEALGKQDLLPRAFLWHHGRIEDASSLGERPLVSLLQTLPDTTACIVCAAPRGGRFSACRHAGMIALDGSRKWIGFGRRMFIDESSISQPERVEGGPSEMVERAFSGGDPCSDEEPSFRSQMAIRRGSQRA